MRVYGYQASLPSGRLWRIVTLTAAAWEILASAAKTPASSGEKNRGAEGIRQTAGTADHRDLDRKAKPENLRRQRILRANADFHGHARPSDADGRLQRHSKAQISPLQH